MAFYCQLKWHRRHLLFSAVLLTHLFIAAVPANSEELGSSGIPRPAATFFADTAQIQKDLTYLASDERAGRDIGSPGLEQAASYIAESFSASGLKVDAFGGTPYQSFDINIGAALGELAHNRLKFTSISLATGNVATTPEIPPVIACSLDQDFRPLGIGNSAARTAPIIFVGYGITAPELNYDDYASINVTGKLVLMLRKEPSGFSKRLQVPDNKNSKHAYFENKLKNAVAHGAVGVLMVNDRDSVRSALANLENRLGKETERLNKLKTQLQELPPEAVNSRETMTQRLQSSESMIRELHRQVESVDTGLLEINEAGDEPMVDTIPVISLSRNIANQLLRASSLAALNELQDQIDRTQQPVSQALRYQGDLETRLNPSNVPSKNVIGYLDGAGSLRDETVVVGAHYDHVGMGGPGSLAPGTVAIHNGADDNASGTTALISAARVLVQRLHAVPNRRRVVLIAFTGEERGLLGSEYYVRHPRWPLASTTAMLNLDMVGRLRDDDLTVYGTGSALGLDAILDHANQRTQFKLFKVASGYGPSDHQSFYRQKVPVLFFFTGLHNDYHRPSDDSDKINFTGLTRITDIACEVATELATRPDRLVYAETTRAVEIRWQATAYLGVQLRELGQGQGVLVSGVTPNGAAQLAGVLAGDQITKLDDREVKTPAEVLETVRSRAAGDPLKIELIRAEQPMSVSAVLKNRPQ